MLLETWNKTTQNFTALEEHAISDDFIDRFDTINHDIHYPKYEVKDAQRSHSSTKPFLENQVNVASSSSFQMIFFDRLQN